MGKAQGWLCCASWPCPISTVFGGIVGVTSRVKGNVGQGQVW